MKRIYDKSKLDDLFTFGDLEETIEALDEVLFSACIYYLNVDLRGVPSETDANRIMAVRSLLETLKSVIVKE